MSRLQAKFAELKKQKRAALIPFIMGGDPNLKTSAAVLAALPGAGADIIEIGVPFSDPMADGPIIQEAGLRAIKKGATLTRILAMVREFRTKDESTPIILMGYYNPIYRYDVKKFCKDAVKAGVDGVIIVDLPPEEERGIRPSLDSTGLHLIRLMAPTSNDKRLTKLSRSASGFVYFIAVAGITGGASADMEELEDYVTHVRRFTKLPVAVGFGIKTPQQAKKVGQFANAVVVGSALVGALAEQKSQTAAVKKAKEFVGAMSRALRRR